MQSRDWKAPLISSYMSNICKWRESNPRARLSYMEKSQRITFTGDFFAKNPTSTNLFGSLICRDRSSLIINEIVLFTCLCPTWSDMGPVAHEPHDLLHVGDNLFISYGERIFHHYEQIKLIL